MFWKWIGMPGKYASSASRWLLLLVLILATFPRLVLAAPAQSTGDQSQLLAATTDDARYFSATGFWVTDPFLSFWEQHGGLQTFGYPLSRIFYQDGIFRQYFERAIFERHDENAGTPYNVLLTRLGSLQTVDRHDEAPFQPIAAAPSTDCSYYPETHHSLCGAFRTYWQAYGALVSFGYPISEPFDEVSQTDGQPHLVQYFERTRFELHSEMAAPYDVLLGLLGTEVLHSRVVPAEALAIEGSNVPAPPPIGPQPLYSNHDVACGFNTLWWGDLNNIGSNAYFLDLAKQSGCGWVRIQAQWSELEPVPHEYRFNPLGSEIDAAKARGLQVLVTVNSVPTWAYTPFSGQPSDPTMFASFMGALSSHFRGQVDAWQLWNEPNLSYEAGGFIEAQGYFDMVQAASPIVRGDDPGALIVLAGLAPNSLHDRKWAYSDIDYLSDLLSIGDGAIRQYIDVVGAHSYGAGNSPDNYWPNNLADHSGWTTAPEFYFRHAEEIHNTLVNAGLGDMPVWLTEFGWTTKNDWPDYGYGDWVSAQQQAQYITRAFEIARTEWPWMQAMFVFSLNAAVIQGTGGPYYGFSMTDQYGQPRPAYDAIKAMPK
jgi:polysaccharide biosynthesis protein PslG